MWGWVVVWLLIVLVGAGWLFLLGREVVRKGLRLATDIQVAAERTAGVSDAPPGSDGSSVVPTSEHDVVR